MTYRPGCFNVQFDFLPDIFQHLPPFILSFHLLENAVVVTLLFMVSAGNLSYIFLFLYHIKRIE